MMEFSVENKNKKNFARARHISALAGIFMPTSALFFAYHILETVIRNHLKFREMIEGDNTQGLNLKLCDRICI